MRCFSVYQTVSKVGNCTYFKTRLQVGKCYCIIVLQIGQLGNQCTEHTYCVKHAACVDEECVCQSPNVNTPDGLHCLYGKYIGRYQHTICAIGVLYPECMVSI